MEKILGKIVQKANEEYKKIETMHGNERARQEGYVSGLTEAAAVITSTQFYERKTRNDTY